MICLRTFTCYLAIKINLIVLPQDILIRGEIWSGLPLNLEINLKTLK